MAEPVLIADEDKGQRGLSGQCYALYELHFRARPGRVAQPATVVERGSALDP